MNVIPGLTLMTRTDASPNYLKAFLDHHLQVCENAFVLACLRPNEDVSAVRALCDTYGDRVRLEVTRHHIFDCWRTISELRKFAHEISPQFVLHIDKDEFIADFRQFPAWCSKIKSHDIDCVVGDMIWRTAPGCKNFDIRDVHSFEALDLLAPVRVKQGSTKCYLTGGDVLLHKPTPGARVAANTQPVEHFGASLDYMEKAIVKSTIPQRSPGTYLKRMAARVNPSPEKVSQVLDSPGLLLYSDTVMGWTNYKDLLMMAARFLPENGVYVETGVFGGRSLGCLAEFLQVLGKKVRVVGYDVFNVNWAPGMRAFRFNPATSEEWMAGVRETLKRVAPWNTPEIVQCDGVEAAQLHEDASVDFVWLDSDHSEEYLIREIAAWLPKLKPSGIIAGHDLAASHPSVEAGLLRSGIEFEPISSSSWIRRGDKSKLLPKPSEENLPMRSLDQRVTVVIKTFIRYATLRKTIRRIKSVWPGLPILVVDDTPLELRQSIEIPGVQFLRTDPDIGLSAGRNRGFEAATTEYVLYTDDDAFPHYESNLQQLEALVARLDAGQADLIGWRGWTISEPKQQLVFTGVVPEEFTPCHVTENAYIARRSMLVSNPHPEEVKVNGEHFAYFYLLYKAGVKVGCSSLLNFINTKTRNPVYSAYRNRLYRNAAKRATGHSKAIWHGPKQS